MVKHMAKKKELLSWLCSRFRIKVICFISGNNVAPLLIVVMLERGVSCYANRELRPFPGGEGLVHPGVQLSWMEIKQRQP